MMDREEWDGWGPFIFFEGRVMVILDVVDVRDLVGFILVDFDNVQSVFLVMMMGIELTVRSVVVFIALRSHEQIYLNLWRWIHP